ncbi:MAG: hypothetical protein OCD01_18520 [Fibrobacterales bacterium]
MKYWKCSILLLLVILIAGVQAQEQKFNVYGFFDLNYYQNLSMDNNTFLNNGAFKEKEPDIYIGNVNVYFDFNPNPDSRVLVEVGLLRSLADKQGDISNELIDEIMINGAPAPAGNQALFEGVVAKEGTEDDKFGGVSLYRAWAEYSYSDNVNIRAGKFITPAGIWNVDHGSPVLTTIAQPKQTSFIPLFPESQTGLMLWGTQFAGDFDIAYNAYMTTGRKDEGGNPRIQDENDPEKLGDFGYGGHASFSGEIEAEFSLGTSIYSGAIRNRNTIAETYGISVTATTPEEAAALPATLTAEALNGENTYYKDVETQSFRELVVGFDAKAQYKGATFQAELNSRTLSDDVTGDEIAFLGWYTMLGYKINLPAAMTITPYGMYEVVGWDVGEGTIQAYPTNMLPIKTFKTSTLGVKIGLLSNTSLKLEYMRIGFDIVNDPFVAASASPTGSKISLANTYKSSDLVLQAFQAQITVAF